MTDDESRDEAAEELIEDLGAPAEEQGDVVGGAIQCKLPTEACPSPTCTSQTYCRAGTVQGCAKPTCEITVVMAQ